MISYDTVSEAVNGLKQRGYNIDFNVEYDCIVCHETPLSLLPNEFEITEVHRFEGDTDPADEAVVYAIESKHGEKGVLVNAFGIYSDSVSDELIEKLKMQHHN
ncbi:MAG: phosphoribosylpyrophosphate synthetase [Sphingobacteriales bacterium]|nr:MAG: phosphoribosylpyrophosphate synthetase [Sphingobacteriales bacterium]